MKVARHFSAGYAFKSELVPEGRLKATSGKRVQASRRDARFLHEFPGTKVPGYLQSFLRNEVIPIFAEVSDRMAESTLIRTLKVIAIGFRPRRPAVDGYPADVARS